MWLSYELRLVLRLLPEWVEEICKMLCGDQQSFEAVQKTNGLQADIGYLYCWNEIGGLDMFCDRARPEFRHVLLIKCEFLSSRLCHSDVLSLTRGLKESDG